MDLAKGCLEIVFRNLLHHLSNLDKSEVFGRERGKIGQQNIHQPDVARVRPSFNQINLNSAVGDKISVILGGWNGGFRLQRDDTFQLRRSSTDPLVESCISGA